MIKQLNKALTLWEDLKDVPTEEVEVIEIPFLHFEAGTDIYSIWHWFEEEFNVSVAIDLMGLK